MQHNLSADMLREVSVKRASAVVLCGLLCTGLFTGCTGSDSTPPTLRERSTPSEKQPVKQGRSYPNVVLIIMDTLRADVMGCYGYPEDTSPELDGMAEQGVLFTTCISQCSWTRPSIGSMLTSLYPRTLGVYKEWNEILADRFITMPEILQDSGFKTIGLTANPNINSTFNFHTGFDSYFDSNVVFPWMKPDEGGFTVASHRLPSAREMFSKVLELAAEAGGRPHYIQVNAMEMHEYTKTGEGALVRPEFAKMFRGVRNRRYLQALRQLSSDIGEFVETLAAMPGWDDTLFVFTSDHGEGLDDHPDVRYAGSHGWALYESQVMVPLIMYNPNGSMPVRTVTERVRLLDLMPTVLDYLEIPVPAEAVGLSLLPIVRGETAGVALPELFVTETQFRLNDKTAVYSNRWKYIENRDIEYITEREGAQGVDPVELQAVGEKENGPKTDKIKGHAAEAQRLRTFLDQWEETYSKAEPTPRKTPISAAELNQLKGIGYLR